MSVDARLVRGGVIGAWALFFVLLWQTGTSDRYLGSRTQWVVPFGAIVLTLAACSSTPTVTPGPAETGRRSRSRRQSAYSRCWLRWPRSCSPRTQPSDRSQPHARAGRTYFMTARPPPPATPADVSFLDIRVAEGDDDFALDAGIHSGLRVRLLGFVSGSNRTFPPGPSSLPASTSPAALPTRCRSEYRSTARTAPPFQARHLARGDRHARETREPLVVVVDRIVGSPEPSHPYLSFRT